MKVVTLASALLVAELSLGGLPAAAARGADPAALEEVNVTARRREENLQLTPLAITAITAEEIRLRAFNNSAETAYTVPNASFRKAQQAFGNTMTAYIRGVGQYDFNYAFEPGVAIYIDDVYHATTMGSYIDLLDLERVEVLRGPQGTLFGRNAIGGAVRFVSSPARGDNTGYAQATVGDYDRLDFRGGYDFPVVEDTLFARVSGVSRERDGHVDRVDFACAFPDAAVSGTLPSERPDGASDCELGTLGGEDVWGARGVLRWVASEDVELEFTADRLEDDSEASANVAIATSPGSPPFQNWNNNFVQPTWGVLYDDRFVAGDDTSYATFADPYFGKRNEIGTQIDVEGYAGTLHWRLAESVEAKLVTAFREYDSYFATDPDNSPLNEGNTNGFQNFEQTTVELQFSGQSWEDRLDWTVGTFWYDGEADSAQSSSIPAFQACCPPAFDPLVQAHDVTESENGSAFMHGIYQLSDRVDLVLGGRYSEDRKQVDFDNGLVQSQLDKTTHSWDYKLGLDYQLAEAIMAYTSVATGYRPQAYNPRPFQASQFKPVDGEELTSWELGLKGDFLDSTLRFNSAVFYSDYEQRIVPAGGLECTKTPEGEIIRPGPGDNVLPNPEDPTDSLGCAGNISKTDYINAPADVWGLEAELVWAPLTDLTISGQAGYLWWSSDWEDEQLNEFPGYVPEWNASLGAQYLVHLPDGATLTPRLDYYLQAEICTQATTRTSCMDSYGLLNARLTWLSAGGDWEAAFGVTNLADEDYYQNIFDLSAFGQMTVEGQPGRPREWYLQLTRYFQ